MRLVASTLVLLTLGCASTYYDTYKAKEPYWYGGGPTRGASLHETLAGLYAPPVADYSLIIAKLDVLQFGGTSAAVVEPEGVEAIVAADTPGDYGIVATLWCRSEYNVQRGHGEKVAWYLLPEGRLEAWEHFDFVELCAVSNQFRPARGDEIALEAMLLSHRDDHFPKSMQHAGQFYQRGLAYLGAKRPDEAVRMLKAGDAAFDVGSRGEQHIDMESSTRIRTADSSDVERARARLVEKLAEAEAEAADPES